MYLVQIICYLATQAHKIQLVYSGILAVLEIDSSLFKKVWKDFHVNRQLYFGRLVWRKYHALNETHLVVVKGLIHQEVSPKYINEESSPSVAATTIRPTDILNCNVTSSVNTD